MEDNQNPFAAPIAVSAPVAVEAPELHGRMPSSVMLAIGCVGIMVALNAIGVVAVAAASDVGVFELVFVGGPFVVGVLVLVGLVRRSRLARQWGRIMGCLGAVLMMLLIVVTAVSLASSMAYVGFSDAEGDADLPFGQTEIMFFMLVGVAIYVIPAVLMWTEFFALGRPSAREYFGLYCPHCNSRRTKAADFLYSKSKCKECEAVW